jgi:hypothetical protein
VHDGGGGAQIPSDLPGVHWLIRPERGPRLVLVHRPEGVMACTHSHRCWVALAPVRGVETHQRWDVVRRPGGRAELSLADERALHPGDVATLVPPRDVHNHGHVTGSGPSPYSLILLGDDMLLFEREEYDPGRGTWRGLAPGTPAARTARTGGNHACWAVLRAGVARLPARTGQPAEEG